MTEKEIKGVIDNLRKQGCNDEMIAKCFVNLFVEGKIDIEQCDAMLSFIGYGIPEEVKKASKKTQLEVAKQLLNS